MKLSTRNYWQNVGKLLLRDRLLQPLAVTYYVTTRCNLNCVYCEEFGAARNHAAVEPLPLDDALRLLQVIRTGVDSLILTGGEPLLYPDIDALVSRARRQLKFRHLTLLSNGFLLPQHEAVLSHIDRLVISLDAVDPEFWGTVIGVPSGSAETILENIRHYSRRQREFGFRMILNSVLTPETLAGARKLLDFCVEHDLLVSFSPQAVHGWPHYDLLVDEAYKSFLGYLIEQKQQGKPILGSLAYLNTLLDFKPYACYPTLVPRILTNGDLVYPCRPIEKEGNSHGGRPCNLLEVDSWHQAIQMAMTEFGPPPLVCSSCFQQCFAEPSLMQLNPLAYVGELLRFPASRQASLSNYAPG